MHLVGRGRHKHAYLSGYPEVSGILVVLLIPQRNSMLKDSLRMPLVEVALVFTGICFVSFSLIAYSSGRTELPQESATTVCCCGSGSLNHNSTGTLRSCLNKKEQ